MKILSVDIGIRNLGICIIEIEEKDLSYKILEWKNICLCDDNEMSCEFMISEKQNCRNKAKFIKNGTYFCKKHALKARSTLSQKDFDKYKQLSLQELVKLCEDYGIKNKNVKNKKSLIGEIEKFIKINEPESINVGKCREINMVDIGISLKKNLDLINNSENNNLIDSLDLVLIENQLSPLANRMNMIQGMISQYFIMKNINNIKFVSSSNKLKLFISNKKTTYVQRKKLGILITKNILSKNNEWLSIINKSKKADDLADCFLQGISYLHMKNHIKLDLDQIELPDL